MLRLIGGFNTEFPVQMIGGTRSACLLVDYAASNGANAAALIFMLR